MGAQRAGHCSFAGLAFPIAVALGWIGVATPSAAQVLKPSCPAGYQYMMGTITCESLKPPTCDAPQGAANCYAVQSGQCQLKDARSAPACQGARLPATVPLTCPAGYQFKTTSNYCYTTKPASCPPGYMLDGSRGFCLKAPGPS